MTSPRSFAQRLLPLLVLVGSLLVATLIAARGPRNSIAAANHPGAAPATPVPGQ